MTTRAFLIRHGRTALNAAGVLRGQIDVPLDAVGEREARELGLAFEGVRLDAVVSSPLRRAVETARPVAQSSGATLSFDERLSDRFYGELAGRSIEQVEQQFGSIDAAPLVEAWQQLETRAQQALTAAVSPLEGDTASPEGGVAVALVSHDAVIRALLGVLVADLASVRLDLPTGSWSEIVRRPGGGSWRAVAIGSLPGGGHRP